MKNSEIKKAMPTRSFSAQFGNYTTSPEQQAQLDALKKAEDDVRLRVNTDVAYQTELLAIVADFERTNAAEIASFVNNEELLNSFRRVAAHEVAQGQRRGVTDHTQAISREAWSISTHVPTPLPLIPRI